MRSGRGNVTAGVAALLEAARVLADADVDEPTERQVLDELQALGPALGAVQAQLARRVGRVHTGATSVLDGSVSTVAWLRTWLHLDPAPARRLVTVGAGLGALPDTQAAVLAGDISVEHAAIIADAATTLGQAVLAGGVETILVDYARRHHPADLRELIRAIAAHLAAEEDATARQQRLHESRWLTASRTFDGAVSIQGLLDPVQGEALLAALAAYTAGPDPQKLSGRTPAQRRADALADLCTEALANPDRPTAGGDRPQVTVTVALATLQRALATPTDAAPERRDGPRAAVSDPLGRLGQPDHPARLGAGREPVCAATARRLACDAAIIPVVLGSTSEPLDIGRLTRVVPTGLRRAIILRDGRCRFPGCDRPPRWCDVHHLVAWADGGPTNLTNCALLCGFHHALVHEGRWTVQLDADTNIMRAWRPDGTPYELTSLPRGPAAHPQRLTA
jgi:hypothetical protein